MPPINFKASVDGIQKTNYPGGQKKHDKIKIFSVLPEEKSLGKEKERMNQCTIQILAPALAAKGPDGPLKD
jgi:hypothetical protein